ncbi:MAG: DNA translocase FtsK 4TM domain-containing protein [Leptospira sp.]|nr:DNA translocase FtsK 4TM domain-containing protein [Leptospira sp.]
MSPKKEFIPYLFLFAGVFCLFSLLSFQVSDESGSLNWFGRLGYFFAYAIFYLLGKSSYLIGLGLIGIGIYQFKKKDLDIVAKLLQLPLLVLSVSLAMSFLLEDSGNIGDSGGALGSFLGAILDFTIGGTGKAILTSFLFAYSTFAILNDESLESTKARILEMIGHLRKKIQSFSVPGNPLNFAYNENVSQSYTQGVKNLNEKTESIKSFLREKIIDRTSNLPESRLEGIHWDTSAIAANATTTNTVTNRKNDYNESSQDERTLNRSAFDKKKIYPRFKNTSLYEGFFEEEKVFRFHSTPVSLKRKLSETADSQSLGFSILDYRSTSFPKDQDSDEYVSEELYSEETFIDEEIEREDFHLEDLQSEGGEVLHSSEDEVEGIDEDVIEDIIEEVAMEEENEEDEILEQEVRIPTFSPPPVVVSKPEHNNELPKTYVPQVPLKKDGYYISPRLLGSPKAKPPTTESKVETDRVARKIEEIISHYGIESKIISMERGPIITRYELTIPNGIKLNKITSLDNELKLYLAVKSIRIVAPIPGKSSIGIEVPNLTREDVYLTDILRETTFAKAQGGLSICIGKDIAGRAMNIDLTRLPHLLVAGTTGSGKSVCLNSMVTSLIFSRSPQELRFIMIDPKMVEMTLYEEIPHLLMPVIIDPRKATKALSWAIQEMEARYQTISKLKCRDFSSYNLKVEEWAHKKGYEKMPYIVIVIDELSDLMMVSGKDLEEQIQRISQKSRAVGIHLVMATQRPSVDVITGLIKANCPARMAFQVAQKTDSRTILDTNGAETLLGKGDFLYRSPTASDLVRVQAPFVTEEEIEKIVEESKKMGSPGYVEINWDEETSESTDGFEEDENLIEDAWRVICQEGKASGSMVQRHLRIGYNKAARIIDILEKRGIISPQIGTKPREILKPI